VVIQERELVNCEVKLVNTRVTALDDGDGRADGADHGGSGDLLVGRGLHSSTFRLVMSNLCVV